MMTIAQVDSPLREVFITTNVSAFAIKQSQYMDVRLSWMKLIIPGVTALARLGVAAARRTTTGTSHFAILKAKVW
jgi:hypothetical protein